MTARCSLRDYFSGNVAVFNVYKWRHSDVIAKTTCWMLILRIKFPTKRIFRILFMFEKLTKWRRFVSYLSNDPRSLIFLCFLSVVFFQINCYFETDNVHFVGRLQQRRRCFVLWASFLFHGPSSWRQQNESRCRKRSMDIPSRRQNWPMHSSSDNRQA